MIKLANVYNTVSSTFCTMRLKSVVTSFQPSPATYSHAYYVKKNLNVYASLYKCSQYFVVNLDKQCLLKLCGDVESNPGPPPLQLLSSPAPYSILSCVQASFSQSDEKFGVSYKGHPMFMYFFVWNMFFCFQISIQMEHK